ncbi:unnamed protein product [Arabis nemorensis]|uniref:Uncharacterized protein n=1 Tax=Arabis nemorensis TaxID=586526 RepID=A0A565C0H8_9BRAS|nr:unnamed protein product [Arabis nemorensis]
MAEFRPDKPVEEEERTEDDDHAKTTEEEAQTEEGDQAKTNEQESITMQSPRRNGQTMNQQEQLSRASSSTQVKLSYSAIASRLATSSSSAINERKKKTEYSSSSRNGDSSGTVEIKREDVTQKTMNLGSTSCATEQSQAENPQEDSSTIRRGDQKINQPNRGSTSVTSDQNNRNRSFGMQQQYSPRFGVDHSYAAGFGPQVTRPFMANQTNILWPGFVDPNYPPWRNQNTYEQHPMRVPLVPECSHSSPSRSSSTVDVPGSTHKCHS